MVFEFASNLAFGFIDRLLGGQGAYDGIIRELTEIEQMVTRRVVVRMAASIKEAWSNVIDLDPEYQGMETNPMFTQVIPPTEMVILVTLDVKIAEVSGLMNVCYPYVLLEPVLSRLSSQYWFASSKRVFHRSNDNLEKSFEGSCPAGGGGIRENNDQCPGNAEFSRGRRH